MKRKEPYEEEFYGRRNKRTEGGWNENMNEKRRDKHMLTGKKEEQNNDRYWYARKNKNQVTL